MRALPAGAYELRSFVYAWENGEHPPTVNAEGDADFVSPGTIRKTD